ncbi:fibronectin-like isoform X2 [Haemaphysalis longicornis]
MTLQCCRREMPAILFVFVLLGSAQGVDANNELIQRNQRSFYQSYLQYFPGAPTDLVVDVSCQNKVVIAWQHKCSNLDGFNLSVCPKGQLPCQDAKLDGVKRKHTVQLPKGDVKYIVLLDAFVDSFAGRTHSQPAVTWFYTYPEVPDIKSLDLTALNYSSIQATWTEQWAHKIQFLVCTTLKKCDEHVVLGTLGRLTFTGLAPDTVYTISAQAQVTRNSKTCQGTRQSRTAQTFPMVPDIKSLDLTALNNSAIQATWTEEWAHQIQFLVCTTLKKCDEHIVLGNLGRLTFTGLAPDTVYTISAQAQVTRNSKTCQGTRQSRTAQTFPMLPDIKSLDLTALNNSAIQATWTEEWAHQIQFLVCTTLKKCDEHVVLGTLGRLTFTGLAPDTVYTISAQAQVTRNSKTCQGTRQSRTAQTFPMLPDIKSLDLTALNNSAIQATWTEEWAHQIQFLVCTTLKKCDEHIVLGNLGRLTFTGLAPDTVYTISAQAQVTRNSKTCQGTRQSRTAQTYPLLPDIKSLDLTALNNSAIQATWTEEWAHQIQFLVCTTLKKCDEHIVLGNLGRLTFTGLAPDTVYTISAQAQVTRNSKTCQGTRQSRTAQTYPLLPDIKSLDLTALNYSVIQATWTEEWAHQIQFLVCTTLKKCDEHIVLGNLGRLTFTGLAPDTVYTISAQAQVTRNSKTCQGTRQSRTAQTYPLPPGPVSNLKYEIVNSVFLNATWDAPNGIDVDGYTIECREVGGAYDVAMNVLELKKSLNGIVGLRLFAKTFNCSVLGFINSTHHERVNGTRSEFEVSTHQLDPPEELDVIVLCKNQANVTWHYGLDWLITGFEAKLCLMNGTPCEKRTLQEEEVSYQLQEYGTLYNISVMAYVNNSLQTVYSRPTTAKFFSVPKLPELDDVSVSALNTTALRVTWKKKWDHEIEFNVCTTPHDCQSHTVVGTLLQHTFTGLHPDTEYNVSAQAEVTLDNITCKGPPQSHSVSTFAEAPGNVTGIRYDIKNGSILVASWNSPKEVKTVKGYTIRCVNSKTTKNVTKDVESLQPLVQVNLKLQKPVGEFYCAVWAYNHDKKGQRVHGPKRTFEVTIKHIDSFAGPKIGLPAIRRFSTYPEVPDIKSFDLTALNYSSIQATWTEEWAHQIQFLVCTTPKKCDEHIVLGNLGQLAFTGLAPDTSYTISAQAQVTRNSKTCQGTGQSRTAQTYPLPPGAVSNLKYEIVDSVFLNATWDAPNDIDVDGYTIECREVGGEYYVARNMLELKTSLEVIVGLRLFAKTFSCSVLAFINSTHHERVNGTRTMFEVSTHQLGTEDSLQPLKDTETESDITRTWQEILPAVTKLSNKLRSWLACDICKPHFIIM